MKKVIEQENRYNIEVGLDGSGDAIILTQGTDLYRSGIGIEKSKAREVALAICPELGEPTIRTDNTKVILNLESELKEAVELLHDAVENSVQKWQAPKSLEKIQAFLTKHKSK